LQKFTIKNSELEAENEKTRKKFLI
jgi:hypothetical protein